MALKAGTTGDYSGSMAEAIEHAFRSEWPSVMKSMSLPATTSPDLQLLFVAVAQGVVKHLYANASSFQVQVTITDSGGTTYTGTGTVTAIVTEGQLD